MQWDDRRSRGSGGGLGAALKTGTMTCQRHLRGRGVQASGSRGTAAAGMQLPTLGDLSGQQRAQPGKERAPRQCWRPDTGFAQVRWQHTLAAPSPREARRCGCDSTCNMSHLWHPRHRHAKTGPVGTVCHS
jgi:hypothetical protein